MLCMDHRFSRQILWLHVGPSNNDTFIIAGYYLDCMKKLRGTIIVHFGKMHTITYVLVDCPTIVRADRGTENCNVNCLPSTI